MPYYVWNLLLSQKEHFMRRLLSTVSPEALLYQTDKVSIKSPVRIPKDWPTNGFHSHHVYLRVLDTAERKFVRLQHSGTLLDWDKKWFGGFSVQTGELIFYADSLLQLHKRISRTTATVVRLN
jgi:hypothetical protein